LAFNASGVCKVSLNKIFVKYLFHEETMHIKNLFIYPIATVLCEHVSLWFHDIFWCPIVVNTIKQHTVSMIQAWWY